MNRHDPCESCPASEECWNYGYDKEGKRIGWFECYKETPCDTPTISSTKDDLSRYVWTVP